MIVIILPGKLLIFTMFVLVALALMVQILVLFAQICTLLLQLRAGLLGLPLHYFMIVIILAGKLLMICYALVGGHCGFRAIPGSFAVELEGPGPDGDLLYYFGASIFLNEEKIMHKKYFNIETF